jgi:hypothetical protein
VGRPTTATGCWQHNQARGCNADGAGYRGGICVLLVAQTGRSASDNTPLCDTNIAAVTQPSGDAAAAISYMPRYCVIAGHTHDKHVTNTRKQVVWYKTSNMLQRRHAYGTQHRVFNNGIPSSTTLAAATRTTQLQPAVSHQLQMMLSLSESSADQSLTHLANTSTQTTLRSKTADAEALCWPSTHAKQAARCGHL